MAVRNFKGFESLQEIECWAGHLETEMKLLSLKMYAISDSSVLAYLNTLTNECVTYGEYSSCFIDTVSTRKSRLKVLVADLAEGESREYGCKASVFRSGEEAQTTSWSIVVKRMSEYRSYANCLPLPARIIHWIRCVLNTVGTAQLGIWFS